MRRLGDWGHAKGYGCYLCDCGRMMYIPDSKAEIINSCNYCGGYNEDKIDIVIPDKKPKNKQSGKRAYVKGGQHDYHMDERPDLYKGKRFGDFVLTGESDRSETIYPRYKAKCRKCGIEISKTIIAYYKGNKCRCQGAQNTLKVGLVKGIYKVIAHAGKNEKGRQLYEVECVECGTREKKTSVSIYYGSKKCTHGKYEFGKMFGIYKFLGRELKGSNYIYVLQCSVCNSIRVTHKGSIPIMENCCCDKIKQRKDFSGIVEKYLDK